MCKKKSTIEIARPVYLKTAISWETAKGRINIMYDGSDLIDQVTVDVKDEAYKIMIPVSEILGMSYDPDSFEGEVIYLKNSGDVHGKFKVDEISDEEGIKIGRDRIEFTDKESGNLMVVMSLEFLCLNGFRGPWRFQGGRLSLAE